LQCHPQRKQKEKANQILQKEKQQGDKARRLQGSAKAASGALPAAATGSSAHNV
jgi:hypothetical protein